MHYRSWLERVFGFHWCRWEDLGRDPGHIITIGKWFRGETYGKIHQRCRICGAHRRIEDR